MKIITIDNTNHVVPSEVTSLKDNPTTQDISEWGYYHKMIFIENHLLSVMNIILNKYKTVIEKYYDHKYDLVDVLEADKSISKEDIFLIVTATMFKRSLENITIIS